MVSMIDQRQMARFMGKGGPVEVVQGEAAKVKKREEKWLNYRNEAMWRRLR